MIKQPITLTLFILTLFSVTQAIPGIEHDYIFKHPKAEKEYEDEMGKFIVHKAPRVKECWTKSSAMESLDETGKKDAYEECLKSLNLHDSFVTEVKKIPANAFDSAVAFNSAYHTALLDYAKALDEKYKDSAIHGYTFEFNWIPWAIILVAFGIIYGFNTWKQQQSVRETLPIYKDFK